MPPKPASSKTTATYLIGLGANLGDRAKNIAAALDHIKADGLGKILACSDLWATPPHLPPDQPKSAPHPEYLNACAVVESPLAPEAMIHALLGIERALGRVRDPIGPRYQPRPIDLDIILWSGGPYSSPDLELPHPRFEDRAFVLLPLNQVYAKLTGSAPRLDLPALIANLPKADIKACKQVSIRSKTHGSH